MGIKITNIEVFSFGACKGATWAAHPISRPASRYENCEALTQTDIGTAIVKITSSEGVYGLGHAGGYKKLPAALIESLYAPMLIGKNPLEIERLWDLMYLHSFPHGREGAAMMAMSAIDIALWDLFGKLCGQPVYQLLGGKVRDRIRVYGTGPDYTFHHNNHFMGTKLPMPYGPTEGREGMLKNEALVREARTAWGDDGDIMLDCWSSWTQEYTMQMAERLADYHIRWIEEPLMPDDYDGYHRLRDLLAPKGILIAGGEHAFTRYGARELIDRQCVDILQTDVWYCGGISELKKIIAYASAHEIMVVPHQCGMAAYHVSINSVVSPFAEYVYKSGQPSMFLGEPVPENGYLSLTDAPGLGYELNKEYAPLLRTAEVHL